jgi:antitoxin PrlF
MEDGSLETQSTLTERYQTTVPSVVRKALHLGKNDKIKFTIEPDGKVILEKVEPIEIDPALDAFLLFLGDDIKHNPERIQAMSVAMKESVDRLVGRASKNLDLNASLDEKDD